MDTASGRGKVDTASGNEHATRQNRTEVKTDGHGARKRSHEVLGREWREWPSAAAGGPFRGMGGVFLVHTCMPTSRARPVLLFAVLRTLILDLL